MIKCPWIVTLLLGHSGFVLPSTFDIRASSSLPDITIYFAIRIFSFEFVAIHDFTSAHFFPSTKAAASRSSAAESGLRGCK